MTSTTPPPVTPAPQPTPAKPFWQSTTFWYNALGLAILAVSAIVEGGAVSQDLATALGAFLAVGNLLIRRYATTGPMTLRTPPDPGARRPRPEWRLDIETMRQLVAIHDEYQAGLVAREGGEPNPNG